MPLCCCTTARLLVPDHLHTFELCAQLPHSQFAFCIRTSHTPLTPTHHQETERRANKLTSGSSRSTSSKAGKASKETAAAAASAAATDQEDQELDLDQSDDDQEQVGCGNGAAGPSGADGGGVRICGVMGCWSDLLWCICTHDISFCQNAGARCAPLGTGDEAPHQVLPCQ